VNCDQTTGKYVAPQGFDLMAWYDELWQNEDANILDIIGLDIYGKLIEMDAVGFVMPEEKSNQAFAITRKRCDYWKFPATDAVCLLISLLCDRPGKIVMLITGLMIAWENRELLSMPGLLSDKADMAWISQYFNAGFNCGREFINAPNWGFPSEAHFHVMWDNQKCDGANYLDIITINEPEGV